MTCLPKPWRCSYQPMEDVDWENDESYDEDLERDQCPTMIEDLLESDLYMEMDLKGMQKLAIKFGMPLMDVKLKDWEDEEQESTGAHGRGEVGARATGIEHFPLAPAGNARSAKKC